MYSSQVPIRTHRSFHDDATFQELMGERLKQSPWLLLSAGLHAVLLLLIWTLMPPEAPKKAMTSVTMTNTDKQKIVEPPPPPPPQPKPEIDPDVVPVEDVNVVDREAEVPSEDNSQETETMSAFDSKYWNTAIGLLGGAAGPYSGRGPCGKKGGRSPQPNVGPGLQWLAAHQDEDGRWDCDGFMKHDNPSYKTCNGAGNAVHDIGVTGLALLAFLGENNTMRQGQYRENVRRGVLWLRAQQEPVSGLFGSRASNDFVYDHAIAAYAMCEAYGLSGYKTLRKSAQLGINYLESHRNPYSVWRYQPRDNDNDISVTGWAIMAYKSAKYFNLMVNDDAMKCAGVFLDEVSDVSGAHGYKRAGESCSRKKGEHAVKFPAGKSQALTAVGLFSRIFLGQDPREKPIMGAAARLLNATPPVWDEKSGSIDHYYWYYATYALFQMGGTPWVKWQKALERAVGPHQHSDMSDKNNYGSWDPVGAWGEDGGRVYSTAILTLTMQANYRYTRLLR
jgi:hypothetical protein